MQSLKETLLQAPDGHLDHSVFPLIEVWDEVPTALQILRVLDECVFIGGASEFTMTILNTLLRSALEGEGISYADLVKKATWRNHGEPV